MKGRRPYNIVKQTRITLLLSLGADDGYWATTKYPQGEERLTSTPYGCFTCKIRHHRRINQALAAVIGPMSNDKTTIPPCQMI